jgi:hypothetical protein
MGADDEHQRVQRLREVKRIFWWARRRDQTAHDFDYWRPSAVISSGFD